ncbi:MAG TPA: hypothetical protein VMV81_09090 [Phycisphaerae bacterium]|nr:hypothetical protein [Phycisphaerae bacterium]
MISQISANIGAWMISFAYAMEAVAVLLPIGGLCLLGILVFVPKLGDRPIRFARERTATSTKEPANSAVQNRLSGCEGMPVRTEMTELRQVFSPSASMTSVATWH